MSYFHYIIVATDFFFVESVARCKREDGIFKRQELPMNPNIVIELFDMQGIDFMGSFVSSYAMKNSLVAVDYVSKRVEVIELPNNKYKSFTVFQKKENIFQIL